VGVESIRQRFCHAMADEDARTDQDEVQGSFLRSAVDQTGAVEQVRGDMLVAYEGHERRLKP